MTRTLLALTLLAAPLASIALACPCNEKKAAACACPSGTSCPSTCAPDEAGKQAEAKPEAKKGERGPSTKR